MSRTDGLYEKAKALIPGGTQLLSKRPEMHLPGGWPAYYARASGCDIWDLDDRHYIDAGFMGIGACILGYADPDVDAAAHAAIDAGSMSSLNAPEEVELAEVVVGLHPWADQVRFARTGGEAMAVAVRIARAHTGRDLVLFSGYHGWHDWYLASNLADESALDGHLLPGLAPKGVPRGLMGSAVPFAYNDTDGFLALVEELGDAVGVVVLEPVRSTEPEPAFLEAVRGTTRARGMVLVVDEITAGWRLTTGGAHLLHGYDPDIAVFGKAMSNGYPMAAVVGAGDVMSAAEDSFISSTYWTERIGPAAALATIGKIRDRDVPRHVGEVGARVKRGWEEAATRHGLAIEVQGIDPLGHFRFLEGDAMVLKTLFTQEMLDRGYLASTSLYASLAHTREVVDGYLSAVDEAFEAIGKALADGKPESRLRGPVCQSGFKRLT